MECPQRAGSKPGCSWACLKPLNRRRTGSKRIFLRGAAGAKGCMRWATKAPQRATKDMPRPSQPSRSGRSDGMWPALPVPTKMPTKTEAWNRPLARGSSLAVTSSGSEPYFAGPKNADCMPIRKTTTSRALKLPKNKAPAASNMTTASAHLVATTTFRFGKRSAQSPATTANSTNGIENNADANDWEFTLPAMPMASRSTVCLKRLSLKTVKN